MSHRVVTGDPSRAPLQPTGVAPETVVVGAIQLERRDDPEPPLTT